MVWREEGRRGRPVWEGGRAAGRREKGAATGEK